MTREKNGFALIEIMVTVLIIGIMATMIFPRLLRRSPNLEWTHVHQELNNLLYFARQEAILNKEIYRLTIDTKGAEHTISVETQKIDRAKPDQKKYDVVPSEYFETRYTLPSALKIHAVYKGKQEQLEENKQVAHCYIIPDGLVEDMLIQMKRSSENAPEQESKATFKVEPFFGTFELSSGYSKPQG
jgi:prepilin-type N-terminal cleavage/methylation domain-containing protein